MENQTRFNLNYAIESWLQELAAQTSLTAEVRRELETHLRDAVAGFQQHGANDEESFWLARRRIGQPERLGEEFEKSTRQHSGATGCFGWCSGVWSFLCGRISSVVFHSIIGWIMDIYKQVESLSVPHALRAGDICRRTRVRARERLRSARPRVETEKRPGNSLARIGEANWRTPLSQQRSGARGLGLSALR
ncbi:MAG TPA: permease prefix domain 1-containing protein [Verrucomicrobiae bacterium]|nr:permease prefix domain 1-containing protein [Verrucomicrobiae bacterium]